MSGVVCRKEEKKRYEEALAAAREAGEERVRQLDEDWRREKEGLRKAHEKQVGTQADMLVCAWVPARSPGIPYDATAHALPRSSVPAQRRRCPNSPCVT